MIAHTIPIDELPLFDNSQNQILHESKIIDVSSNFFLENNFKRYLIFGLNSLQNNILKNNFLYGIQSDHGFFFYVSVLPETNGAAILVSPNNENDLD